MQALSELLGKSVTRYIIPGLTSVVFLIWLPLVLFTPELMPELMKVPNLLSLPMLFVLSIIFGYLLDCVGAYSWTLSFRSYKENRSKLLLNASEIFPSIDAKDPDQYLAEIWIIDEKLYERIFLERAEWVMILETSFIMFIGSIIISGATVIFFFLGSFKWYPIVISFIMFSLSYLSSRKGIQRMCAHNVKVLRALKHIKDSRNK